MPTFLPRRILPILLLTLVLFRDTDASQDSDPHNPDGIDPHPLLEEMKRLRHAQREAMEASERIIDMLTRTIGKKNRLEWMNEIKNGTERDIDLEGREEGEMERINRVDDDAIDLDSEPEEPITNTDGFDHDSESGTVCSFGTCVEHAERGLFSGEAAYHLIKKVHEPFGTTDERDDDISRHTGICGLAIVLAAMPHTGMELQMKIVERILSHPPSGSRKYVYWNFHAHATLSDEDAGGWKDMFESFVRGLAPSDIVIVRAPYSDDDLALTLCRKTVVISGHRSIDDIVLNRVLLKKEYDASQQAYDIGADSTGTGNKYELNSKQNMAYLRSILHHHKRWSRKADLNVYFEEFIDASGECLESFVGRLCKLIGKNMQDIGHCTKDLIRSTLEHETVQTEILELQRNEQKLVDAKSELTQEEQKDQEHIANSFRSWTVGKNCL